MERSKLRMQKVYHYTKRIRKGYLLGEKWYIKG